MEEECEPGKYGNSCSHNCSQNCESLPNSIVLCDKETGECFAGCKAGVYGDLCDQLCSINCKEHTCNQLNGHCTRGCRENHIGDFCETRQEVHQGTTYSSHTTVTTGEAPTSKSQIVIPVVVTILVLILVGFACAVIIFIWRIKKKKASYNIHHCSGAKPSAIDCSVAAAASDITQYTPPSALTI
ncbi:multiple epidermal growth factor-like domains protein 10 [Haliotis rubra]|uniref:multiple epidermal growth factor-like domains protein 10 n=1 Tax=Haliotis rubra TaxID=36100 RepID=UPI001EE5CFE0|nr:multiple epidermal growth factor-like domains protein 10 [Haliotis rubra]